MLVLKKTGLQYSADMNVSSCGSLHGLCVVRINVSMFLIVLYVLLLWMMLYVLASNNLVGTQFYYVNLVSSKTGR